MDTCRVIVVDDDNDEALLFKDALEETNKIIVQAICCDYGELVSSLETAELPDLILCDIRLPLTNGIEIGKKLQKVDKYKTIPFLLITGVHPLPSLLSQASELNIIAVLLKPFSASGFTKFADKLIELCGTDEVLNEVLSFE